MSTSWTQTDLDALEASIKTGVLEVRYGDRLVRYHSMAEMLQLRSVMRDEVGAAAGTSADRFSYGVFEK